MAEYLFRVRSGPGPAWTAASAGLVAPEGRPPTDEAIAVMKETGVDLSAHRSRLLTRGLVDAADLIAVMTASHRQQVLDAHPDAARKVRMLTSFGTANPAGDIPDPIGQSIFTYRKVRDQIESAVLDLILSLREPDRAPGGLRVAIGSDHGGFELKERLKPALAARGVIIEDVGCYDRESVDYPDFAAEVARRVSEGAADQGIVVCTTGIGVSIAANKCPNVRAALCLTPHMAEMARRHNDANVLALGGGLLDEEQARAILDSWLAARFEGGRHERRVRKMMNLAQNGCPALREADPEIFTALEATAQRSRTALDLRAAADTMSPAVREAIAAGSDEGWSARLPDAVYADAVETLAAARVRSLFRAEHANVRPADGAIARACAIRAALAGGGAALTVRAFQGAGSEADAADEAAGAAVAAVGFAPADADYEAVARAAARVRPRLLTVRADEFPRPLDFERLRSIADRCAAELLVDLGTLSGLAAAGAYPDPAPFADYLVGGTGATMRGPGTGFVLCRAARADPVDRAVTAAGGGAAPVARIAAAAVCFREAGLPALAAFAQSVRDFARALAERLAAAGVTVPAGGTDTHLVLADLPGAADGGAGAIAAFRKAGLSAVLARPADGAGGAAVLALYAAGAVARGLRPAEAAALAAAIAGLAFQPAGPDAVDQARRRIAALLEDRPA